MSFIKIWIHAVWGTKHREPVLTREKRKLLFHHMRDNALAKGIYVNTIDGHVDHVHCLFELNAEIPLAKTMQLLKGESSYWANQQHLFSVKLDWANEYFAASVSESVLGKVRQYIENQDEHHKKMTFAQEYDMFLEKSGIRRNKQRNP